MVNIYITKINKLDIAVIKSNKRKEMILKTTNLKIRNSKIASWHLLEEVLEKEYQYPIDDNNISCDEYGKWHIDNICFSISHTDSYVVVALSDTNVGIDIEENLKRFDRRLFDKITTPNEKLNIKYNSYNTVSIWTKKEAIYKKDNQNHFFNPAKIETMDKDVITFKYQNLIISVTDTQYKINAWPF